MIYKGYARLTLFTPDVNYSQSIDVPKMGNIIGRIILLEYSLGFMCGLVPNLNLSIIPSATADFLYFLRKKRKEI